MLTSVQGGTPPEVPKYRSQQRKRTTSGINRSAGSKMGAITWKCVVLLLICFDVVSHHFGHGVAGLGINFSIMFMIDLDMCSNIVLKLVDLCKCTAPTREHVFWEFGTTFSYDMFMIVVLFPTLVFAPFWYRVWRPCWIVLGSTVGALGCQKVDKMS